VSRRIERDEEIPLVVFLGDIYVDSGMDVNGTDYINRQLLGFISKHPYRAANVEGSICKNGYKQEKYSALKIEPSKFIRYLKILGLNIALLANNHTMDYGEECLYEMLETFRDNSVNYAGAGKNIYEAFKSLTIKVRGIKITIFNFSTVFIPQSRASVDKPGIAGIRMRTYLNISYYDIYEEPGAPYVIGAEPLEEDLNMIREIIAKDLEAADLRIVYIHWGIGSLPYSQIVLNYMRKLSRFFADLGIDLIIGSHPHILLPCEKIGKSAVIYSIGNFIFTHKPKDLVFSNVGGIVSISYSNSVGGIVVDLMPVCLDNIGFPKICPEPFENILEIYMFAKLSERQGINPHTIIRDGLKMYRLTYYKR